MHMWVADKIKSWSECRSQVKSWQSQHEKVVFTNGCFDILHLGHVEYLEKASKKGQHLIVGINSDASVQLLKGEGRPIVSQEARMRLIAALHFVDLVVCFEEETPADLISYLLPDILIKGSDYKVSNIVGADTVLQNGGKVETIELVEGFSTSNIIKKIKQYY